MDLVLLTIMFPFGDGEQFVENELPFLSSTFERITIVPIVSDGSARDFNQPQNVFVDTSVSNQLNSYLPVLRGIFSSPKLILSGLKEAFRAKKPLLHGYYAVKYAYTVHITLDWLKNNFDSDTNAVFYSYWLNQSATALACARSNNIFPNALMISRAHGGDLYSERAPSGVNVFQSFQAANLDQIFCISERGLGYLKELYPAAKDTFVLSRLGVPAAPGLNPPDEKNTMHFVSCSHVSKLKRVDLIFQTLTELSELMPAVSIKWTHFGSGPEFDSLKKQTEKGQSGISVELLGHRSTQAILDFYKNTPVTCFINLSLSEGIPVSIMEAYSFGIPALATDVGGTSEIVRDQSGTLVSVDDPAKEIARKLQSFLNSPSFKESGRNAYLVWEKYFNAPVNYNRFAGQLQEARLSVDSNS